MFNNTEQQINEDIDEWQYNCLTRYFLYKLTGGGPVKMAVILSLTLGDLDKATVGDLDMGNQPIILPLGYWTCK